MTRDELMQAVATRLGNAMTDLRHELTAENKVTVPSLMVTLADGAVVVQADKAAKLVHGRVANVVHELGHELMTAHDLIPLLLVEVSTDVVMVRVYEPDITMFDQDADVSSEDVPTDAPRGTRKKR